MYYRNAELEEEVAKLIAQLQKQQAYSLKPLDQFPRNAEPSPMAPVPTEAESRSILEQNALAMQFPLGEEHHAFPSIDEEMDTWDCLPDPKDP